MSQTANMKPINTKQLKLAHDLIQGIDKQNYEYIYRGKFTKTITSNLLSLTENYLGKDEGTARLKKKIYFVMVECLQNITKHQDKRKDVIGDESGILVLQKQSSKYYITTGNVIENENIDRLNSILEKVNSLNSKDLKVYYQQMLVNGEISEKGGAGLGLIAMARKTGNKLLFDFQKVNDQFSYFYLRTEMPLSSIKDEETEQDKWKYSFEKIKKIHEILLKEDILLNFNGTFDHDNLINLLPIIDAQMQGTLDFKKRVFKIMFEMLHNIVEYSEDHTNENAKNVGDNPGIFLLGSLNDKLYFTAGNYLHTSKIATLRDKFDFVNRLDGDELRDFYNKVSSYFESSEMDKPDLSIIEMKLRSGNALNYDFNKVSENYSFFTLQATI